MKYYIEKTVEGSFEDVYQRIKEALSTEGFGIVSEIDMDKKFRESLGESFRKYRILGACNPSLAFQALKQEDKVGTMLPCNVIMQEIAPERIEVAAVDPAASMQAVGNKLLGSLAVEVKAKLSEVINVL